MTQAGEAGRPDLDARYGRKRSRTLNRVLGAGAAVAVVVVFAAWLVWGGSLSGASTQFEARDIGFEVLSDREVRVEWQFTIEPGTPAKCAVHALNSTYAIVGWKEVDLPASDQLTRRLTETVLTTERAVTGLIYRCWLP